MSTYNTEQITNFTWKSKIDRHWTNTIFCISIGYMELLSGLIENVLLESPQLNRGSVPTGRNCMGPVGTYFESEEMKIINSQKSNPFL